MLVCVIMGLHVLLCVSICYYVLTCDMCSMSYYVLGCVVLESVIMCYVLVYVMC